jgi:cobaltochelatase CobT
VPGPEDQTHRPYDPDELPAGVVRALAGLDDVRLRGGLWFRGRGQLPVYAPHVFPLIGDDPGSFRGAADGVALRLIGSDHELYRRVCPEDAPACLVFELLEQFRVESMAPRTMPGVGRNLRRRHELWSLAVHHSGLTATERGLVLYTVAQICRSWITSEPVIAETEDLIEATRGTVAKILGAELRALRRHRGDQSEFAIHARVLAEAVAAMLTVPSSREVARQDADNSRLLLASLPDLSGQIGQDRGEPSTGSATAVPRPPGYQVFTSVYDEERRIATLARPDELTDYRERLDARIARQGVSVMRLVRQLTTVLAIPAPGRWEAVTRRGI